MRLLAQFLAFTIGIGIAGAAHAETVTKASLCYGGDSEECYVQGVLAYEEGMSHREISETTGLPLGTAKSHVVRGAQKLRRWLGGGTGRY